jgi:hypothetical protein
MFTPEHYRAKAAEYGELAKTASGPGGADEGAAVLIGDASPAAQQ